MTTMEVAANGGIVGCTQDGSGFPLVVIGAASEPNPYEPPGFFRRNFAGDYTVIATDLRETGKTKFPAEPYSISDLADDTAGAVRVLGYERAHFAGFSHTGLVAQEVALRHPDLVDHLILANTSHGGPVQEDVTPETEWTSERYQAMGMTKECCDTLVAANAGNPEALQRLTEIMVSPSMLEQHRAILEQTMAESYSSEAPEEGYTVGQRSPEANGRFWYAIARFTSIGRLSDIKARTLFIAGEDDRMVELDVMFQLWREIPQAVLVALEKVGHVYYVDAPERSLRIIKAFLRDEL